MESGSAYIGGNYVTFSWFLWLILSINGILNIRERKSIVFVRKNFVLISAPPFNVDTVHHI